MFRVHKYIRLDLLNFIYKMKFRLPEKKTSLVVCICIGQLSLALQGADSTFDKIFSLLSRVLTEQKTASSFPQRKVTPCLLQVTSVEIKLKPYY